MVRQFQLVDSGPSFTPLRFGLLSAATIIDDPDPQSQGGTVIELDPCGIPVSVTGGPCSAARAFTREKSAVSPRAL